MLGPKTQHESVYSICPNWAFLEHLADAGAQDSPVREKADAALPQKSSSAGGAEKCGRLHFTVGMLVLSFVGLP